MYYNTRMVFTRLRRAGGIVLSITGLVVLLWGSWPARQVTHEITYSYGKELALPVGWDGLQLPPSLKDGIFSLQWPAWIRLGDEGKIRLQLDGKPPKPPCPDGDTDHLFTIVSRLELPGVRIVPGSELSQPIVPCQPMIQGWTIRPSGGHKTWGTIWLHLGASGLPPGSEPEMAVAAVPLVIPVTSLFGLGGAQARLVGVLAILIGLALNIDLLVRRA